MNIKFRSPLEFKPGIIAGILERSYAELISSEPAWNREKLKWAKFDEDAFRYPDSVGRCVFLTLADDKLVGFGSYDNRPMPGFGILAVTVSFRNFEEEGSGRSR